MMKDKALQIEDQIIGWRRGLHQIPELGLELPKTSAYVQERLKEMDIPFKTLVNGNAIVALIEGTKEGEGKVFAIRADMDALPIKEETGLPFASTNGCMHACGHDGHTAMLLGAAKLLSDNKDSFSGTVKLLFQPGEEYPGGAKPMIEEGALENPRPDAIIGLHAGNLSAEVQGDTLGIGHGPVMASMDRIAITIEGKGAHGAYPQDSVDPISTAAEVISALQRVVSREIAATEPAVLSITRIEGGFNQNIIPNAVELEGTVRTFNNETRSFIAKRIEEIAQGICGAMRATAKVEYDYRYPPVITNAEFTDFFEETAKKIVGEENIVHIKNPLMGGEDMAFFLEEIHGTFFFFSTPGEVDGQVHAHHHPKFDLKEDRFATGSAILAQTAVDFLQ